eukprot:TRINITY_DN3538_c5_g1_i1.p1 TRINITY_DN3538_c5_g1~~TRINITY_DN3538_c5_g1_i1.p1  ORF type:complete len:69 (+),score=3.69 TRINITY_DN3538_c5_g1_i1:107-313(+)
MAIPRKICSLQTCTYMLNTKLSYMNTKIRRHTARNCLAKIYFESIGLVLFVVQVLCKIYWKWKRTMFF